MSEREVGTSTLILSSPLEVTSNPCRPRVSMTTSFATSMPLREAQRESRINDAVQKIRSGDMKPVGFLVGQVMQATGGRADPKIVQELVRAKATDSQ